MRVAICQDSIGAGGRLHVILGFIQVLNAMGIKPDILTALSRVEWDQIGEKYGVQVDVDLVKVRQFTRPGDFSIPYFNWQLRRYGKSYDLLINTTNSLIFLPKNNRVLTYLFFPRKKRIFSNVWSLHRPEAPLRTFSKRGVYRGLLRLLYRASTPQPHHQIISMTEFTTDALRSVYPCLPESIPAIYPPVDLHTFCCPPDHRAEQVVTLGRFTADKRQLEQIRIAEQLPGIPFHIVGFMSNREYFSTCQQYIEEHSLTHVHLYPNAPFSQMVELLQNARYFLHTLVNEPFGITAVQAIAAGCVPIVHDSGGQRETVPEMALRYQRLDEVPRVLSSLHDMDASAQWELVAKLQAHVSSHFDQHIFEEKIRAILESYIR